MRVILISRSLLVLCLWQLIGLGKSSYHFEYICCAVGHPLFIACPPGHIISIGSAEVHLSPFWHSDRACGHCDLTGMTCPLPHRLRDNVRACNRRQYCYITQDLNHEQCSTFANGNFIRLHTVTYNCIRGLDPAAATPTQNVLHIMPTNSPSFIHGLNMSTTTADPTRGKVVLSNEAVVGIAVAGLLLLLLVIMLLIIVICLCRRLASSKVNSTQTSHVECAPNMYEMSTGDTTHINVQSEADAQATSTKPVVTNPAENGRMHPSAPPP